MNYLVKKIINILNLLSGLILIIMMLLCVCNIVFRFFGYPIKGTFELMGFLGAMICSLSLVDTERKGGHIYVGIFFDKLPKKIQRIFTIVGSTISVIVFSLIFYKLMDLGIAIKEFGELSETLNIPYYPVIFICAGGVFFALLLIIFSMVDKLKKR